MYACSTSRREGGLARPDQKVRGSSRTWGGRAESGTAGKDRDLRDGIGALEQDQNHVLVGVVDLAGDEFRFHHR